MNETKVATAPHWYAEDGMSSWERAKEAFRRDWEQTKHDLGLPGGHELNQNAADTLEQAASVKPIPADDRPNPPKVIGSWDEAEYPIGYGYTAREKYITEHPVWNEGLEQRLRAEWDSKNRSEGHRWTNIGVLVRYGYEHTLPG